MAKRLAIGILVVLGTFVLVVSGFFLVLFLAPGFSMFGIKYIRKDTHKVIINDTRVTAYESIGSDFNGSIIVNSDEIPVEICFSNTGTDKRQIRFNYYDNYQGITDSNFDDPSLEVTKDEYGNIVFNTHEFRKWIYESSSSERGLVIYLPLAYLESSASVNLTIKNGSGGVKFVNQNEATAAGRVPKFNNLTIETTGKVDITRRIDAENYTQTSNNSIVVGSDLVSYVNATNYTLKSISGNITVSRAISGDLNATTNDGNIKFVSCKNLIVNTKNGDVYSVSENAANVSGLVDINSKGGSVTLGNVLGAGSASSNNKINTGSGNVNIGRIVGGEITTSFGYVTIKYTSNVKVNTNLGKVKIEEATNSIEVNTKRGSVELGGEGMTINNPTVTSVLGRVYMLSSSGKAKISTIYSDVSFTNQNCSEISISSGGKVTGRKLSGKVDISANKNVDIEFSSINGDVNIELANTVTYARIVAGENHIQNTRYYFKAKYVTRYVKAPNGTYSPDARGEELNNTNISTSLPLLKVTGENANVEVYFNSVS